MGEIFKRLTEWKKSPILRLANRFAKKPVEKARRIELLEISAMDKPVKGSLLLGFFSAAKDINPEVRLRGVLGIRNTMDMEAVPYLINMLKDEESAIRSAAAKALRSIGLSEDCFRTIASMLSGASTPQERSVALTAFQEIGDPRFIRVIADDYRTRPDGTFPEAVWIIVAINSQNPEVVDCVPSLIRLLYDRNRVREGTKSNLAEMLGYIADLCRSKGSAELLLARLDEAEADLKRYPWPSKTALSCIANMRQIVADNKNRHHCT